MSAPRLCAISSALLLWSCGPAASEGGFDSANSSAKLYAIEQAVRDGDRSAIRRIVEQLDSDDPAVRFIAIATLQRLTGETYGYRDFDPEPVRREAIQRWVQAIENGELNIKPAASDNANDSGSPLQNASPHG
jgi:HEAT repeat protein